LCEGHIYFHLQDQYSIPFPFPHCEKLALCYNLNFDEVGLYINFESTVCYALAELYVISVYLNLFLWRGGREVHVTFKGRLKL
jgi:hypothetical protein